MRAMLLDFTKCVGCGACVEACRGGYTTLDTASAAGREVNYRRHEVAKEERS
jgi:Fe-S-cluster-containing dehydrogenase component